jgi:hypothetical protein
VFRHRRTRSNNSVFSFRPRSRSNWLFTSAFRYVIAYKALSMIPNCVEATLCMYDYFLFVFYDDPQQHCPVNICFKNNYKMVPYSSTKVETRNCALRRNIYFTGEIQHDEFRIFSTRTILHTFAKNRFNTRYRKTNGRRYKVVSIISLTPWQ